MRYAPKFHGTLGAAYDIGAIRQPMAHLVFESFNAVGFHTKVGQGVGVVTKSAKLLAHLWFLSCGGVGGAAVYFVPKVMAASSANVDMLADCRAGHMRMSHRHRVSRAKALQNGESLTNGLVARMACRIVRRDVAAKGVDFAPRFVECR
jgi:hypothetical protein